LQKLDLWDKPLEAQKLNQEFSELEEEIKKYERLSNKLEELSTALELVKIEEKDEELNAEFLRLLEETERNLREWEISLLLQGRYDKMGAICSLQAGAGGTESQDWAEMLLRMYLRWAEKKKFKTKIVDISPGEEAGIKSVTFMVYGNFAYGFLKAEKGVHRLVRISPFDANARRHTSFAAMDVIPQFGEEIKIEISPQDLRIDTFRASGAGGQYVNKTDSAVRITHIPTGIVVQCQNERSQHSNKITAMKILQARLYDLEERKRKEKLEALRGERKEIGWGSQIRSYVFHPYNLVKDHRTGYETSSANDVIDGELDAFIYEYLKYEYKKKIKVVTDE